MSSKNADGLIFSFRQPEKIGIVKSKQYINVHLKEKREKPPKKKKNREKGKKRGW
jgi:Fe-S cluster assembly ATPase SufC